MKKPVAKRPRTGLQRGFDSLTQDADSEKVNEVIRRLTGKSASYPAERPAPPTPPPVEAPARQVSTRAKTTVVNTTTVKNTPVSIDSNYYKIPNDVSDVLATMQTPAEQAVYHRLFRLSYGYNQDVCRVGMHALSRAMNISSKKTIAKAIAGLIEKQHIAIAQEAAGDVRGTWYRVFLPEDIASANHPTNIKNTTVHSTTVKNSTVIVANGGIHSTTVKNTRVEQPIETHDENSTGIKNTAVIFTPITTSLNNTLSLSAIVDQFYELLGQRPTKKKRERALAEAQKLEGEGFSLEDLAYAVTWMVEKHPDTGAFERLSFFIDQALKDRKISKGTRKREAQRQAEAAQQQQENEHIDAEQQRIEEMLNSLPEDGRAQLRERAAEEVSEEHGAGAFGHDMLVRLKMEELIRERDSDDVT